MSPNSQNKREQYSCYQENIRAILKTLSNLSDSYFKNNEGVGPKINRDLLNTLIGRFMMHNRVSGGDIGLARVQRDLGYFLLLTFLEYDFSQYTGDTRDMEDIFKRESSLEEQTGKHENVVRMIQEAQEAIESGGSKPPANEMLYLTQSEVASLVKQILSNS